MSMTTAMVPAAKTSKIEFLAVSKVWNNPVVSTIKKVVQFVSEHLTHACKYVAQALQQFGSSVKAKFYTEQKKVVQSDKGLPEQKEIVQQEIVQPSEQECCAEKQKVAAYCRSGIEDIQIDEPSVEHFCNAVEPKKDEVPPAELFCNAVEINDEVPPVIEKPKSHWMTVRNTIIAVSTLTLLGVTTYVVITHRKSITDTLKKFIPQSLAGIAGVGALKNFTATPDSKQPKASIDNTSAAPSGADTTTAASTPTSAPVANASQMESGSKVSEHITAMSATLAGVRLQLKQLRQQ
jgi:hypothetical protein